MIAGLILVGPALSRFRLDPLGAVPAIDARWLFSAGTAHLLRQTFLAGSLGLRSERASQEGDGRWPGTRRSKVPIEDTVHVVLMVLSGELTAAEAARRHGVRPMSVSTWKQSLVDGGTKALEGHPSGPAGAQGPPELRGCGWRTSS
jgi:transposase-like protein